MSCDSVFTNLTNHFLIAMPDLQDDLFAHSVVYLCQHNQHGALGLVINKPCDLSLKGLFDKVALPMGRADLANAAVFVGGPIQLDRGFVLHETMLGQHSKVDESVYESTVTIPGGPEMITSRDLLEAIASGCGSHSLFVSLGYSAWAQGQLEAELSENSWLTVPADMRIIFQTPAAQRYEQAMQLLGLQSWMLSRFAGHA